MRVHPRRATIEWMGPRELREKYAELRALRTDTSGADPTARMRALAARFPGALREIDVLPLETIDARLLALDAVLAGAPEERWMRVAAAFHVAMRAALDRKRAGASARAPSGRLTDLVWAELTERFGEPTSALRVLVFGPRRRSPRQKC